jgi:hypothetical protein
MFSAGPGELRQALLTVLSPVDQAVFTPEVREFMYSVMAEGAGERIEGWRDDDLAFAKPWGSTRPTSGCGPPAPRRSRPDGPARPRQLAGGEDPGRGGRDQRRRWAHHGRVSRIPDVHEWLLQRF